MGLTAVGKEMALAQLRERQQLREQEPVRYVQIGEAAGMPQIRVRQMRADFEDVLQRELETQAREVMQGVVEKTIAGTFPREIVMTCTLVPKKRSRAARRRRAARARLGVSSDAPGCRATDVAEG